MVRETIRKTTTDIGFFGLSKPEVFEALADWYEYHDEEELNYLGLSQIGFLCTVRDEAPLPCT